MYRTLLGVSKEFVPRGKAMYRTLLATCGSANNRYFVALFFNEDELQNDVEPHVASNVRYIA